MRSNGDWPRQGDEVGKHHCGLHTKTLMQGMGTRLECRHRSFVRAEKNIMEIYFKRKIDGLPGHSNQLTAEQ